MPLASKYEITEREAHWRDFWAKQNIYAFDENSDKPIFSVDTPPPYVSADHLHPGHIMSYSQAEFVVRFKRMQGYNVFYPMGFDDNGLPTERHVEKKYKIKNKDSISRSEFVKLCLEETQKGIQTYRNLWSLLGISVDWSKTYSSINAHSQKISQWSFLDLYKKGLLTQREEPIMWDISFQSALAQTDLEDSEQDSHLNDIIFTSQESGEQLIIATTRPELLPAAVALFFHPEDSRYQHLIGTQAITPISGHTVPILTDETVDRDFGTGLMMVCTWGDSEDIAKWKKYNLDTRLIFNQKGILNELAGNYAGGHISKLRQLILADLQAQNLLVKQTPITHTVQVSERSGTPIEFILTKQWFINVVENKEELLEQGKKLNWYPKRMFSIYADWVSSLKWDWCISRQRYYGVPIPVWYHKQTGEIILPQEDELPVDPTEYTPRGYKAEDLIPEQDVLDTWMTSSMSPEIGASLVSNTEIAAKLFPSSLRPQAFEIIRTWLFYTVTKAYFHYKSLPFNDVMISGHGLDNQGRKISKRLGNFTPPEQTITTYGADAMRYWATGTTLGENIRFNEEEIKKGKKTVNKLFNAGKFAEMHLQNFTLPDQVPELELIDKWILAELNQTITLATESFEQYEYYKARTAIDQLFWSKFTDYYLELIKYRLYDESPEGQKSRLAAQYTLYVYIENLLKLYAPILPFITEELYQGLFLENNTQNTSIHTSNWPQSNTAWKLSEDENNIMTDILAVVEAVRAYKSQNSISLGKEIETFTYTSTQDLSNYENFLAKALRVGKLMK
jgi:valyl-tRNA synthetase